MGDGQVDERMDKMMGAWVDTDEWMGGRMYEGIPSWVGRLANE